MARIVTFDFTDAPPAQGGGGSDHVPPGRYIVRLTEINDGKSKSQKRMVTASWEIAQGESSGRRLRDNFVLEGESKFGYQRLNACLVAIALQVPEKAVKIDLDSLVGRICEAVVIDDEIPANDNYPARMGSKITSYFPIQNANGKAKAAPAAAPVAAAPAPAAKPAAAAAVAVAEPEVVAAPEDAELLEVADSVDSIFG